MIPFQSFHHTDLACAQRVGELNTNVDNLLSLRFYIRIRLGSLIFPSQLRRAPLPPPPAALPAMAFLSESEKHHDSTKDRVGSDSGSISRQPGQALKRYVRSFIVERMFDERRLRMSGK